MLLYKGNKHQVSSQDWLLNVSWELKFPFKNYTFHKYTDFSIKYLTCHCIVFEVQCKHLQMLAISSLSVQFLDTWERGRDVREERIGEWKKNAPQSTLADVPELALVLALVPRSILEGACSSGACMFLSCCAQGAFDIIKGWVGGEVSRSHVFLRQIHCSSFGREYWRGLYILLFQQYCYLSSGKITHLLSQNRSCTHKLFGWWKLIPAAQTTTYFQKCTLASSWIVTSCMLHTSPH